MSSNSTEIAWLVGSGGTLSEKLLKSLYESTTQLRGELILIAYFLLQFTQSFIGPILYKGVTVLFSAVANPVSLYMESFRKGVSVGLDDSPIETSPTEEPTSPISQLGPAILTAEEDKKSSRATDRDISVLYKKGYNRYRYVSKAFIKRNRLNAALQEDDDSDGNNENADSGALEE